MSASNIGKDEWVAQVAQRRTQRRDLWGRVCERLETVHASALVVLLGGLAALLPLLTSNDYILRVATTACLYAILALGMTVVVGYVGLLDLGYVAFFGLSGYAYALLSSNQLGLHLPTWVSIPLVVALSALVGLVLGLPSLRLRDDYLAIVTLGFAQIFGLLALNLDRVTLPWSGERINLTGGPNGIVAVDRFQLFGWQATGMRDYFYLFLVALVIVLVAITHLQDSRVGRAWRALREDELATGAMGMPVRRLKLLAFAVGAAIAGLSGSLATAWRGSVFPNNFDITLLLLLYAMVVLGGLGSLPGALTGAVVLVVVPELLRDPGTARVLFYAGLLILVLGTLRPRWHAGALLGAVLLFGLLVKLIVGAAWPDVIASPIATGGLAGLIQGWLVLPREAVVVGNVLFVVVIALLMLVSRARRPRVRLVLLVPALYLLVLVWETRLVTEPGITRMLLFGALLVLLMMHRPHGLFGRPRVEVM